MRESGNKRRESGTSRNGIVNDRRDEGIRFVRKEHTKKGDASADAPTTEEHEVSDA